MAKRGAGPAIQGAVHAHPRSRDRAASAGTRSTALPERAGTWRRALPAALVLVGVLYLVWALLPGERDPVPPAPGAAMTAPTAGNPPASARPAPPERLVPRVLAVHPHDPESYTQGLLWHGGALYESTGQYGLSSLRRVDLATGKVLKEVKLDSGFFGEGLALLPGPAGDRLLQLTWQEGVALVWDRESFRKLGERRYQGEGWGLCLDGRRLLMSDGSDRLTVRDPETFAARGEIRVTREGVPVDRLNELECAEGAVWANVYQTPEIVRLDPATGRVTAVVDASRLLTPAEWGTVEVLNGIAYDPVRRRFFLTGKHWPKLFEVEMAPAP